jgi:hypothetical protein
MPGDAFFKEPDLLQVVLLRVRERLTDLSDQTLREIEADIRAAHGGERVRIAKRRPHLTSQERQELVSQALGPEPDEIVTQRFGIHRSTLYRALKR